MEYKTSSAWDFGQVKVLNKYLEGHNGFIAGGAFKNIFCKEKVKDVDVFFKNEVDWKDAVKYYDEHEDYYFFYENDKVKAFKSRNTNMTVECIKEIFGSPSEILDQFDFTITQFAYYKITNEEELVENYCLYHEDYFTHLHLKRLVIDDVNRELPYIVSTFNRLFKYGKYGYFPCRGTKLRVITGLREITDEQMAELDGSLYYGID